MFKRKLKALHYPAVENFDPNDESNFRDLVVWLEDNKIRQYKQEQRDSLRDTKSPTWASVFSNYIKDTSIPLADPQRTEVVEWLLGTAVRLEYSDNSEKYSSASAEQVKANQQEAPKMVTANPLDKLDFSSPEFVAGVNSLAEKLKVSKHPNHLMTLEAIAALIKLKYNKESIRERETTTQKQEEPFPLHEIDLGFDCGDPVLNQAARILRLLYIHDLRDLQTKINECIVSIQTVTANPKTDTRLGKVGF